MLWLYFDGSLSLMFFTTTFNVGKTIYQVYGFFVIEEWVKEQNLVLRTWAIRKCPFCAFYKYLRIQLYRYAYIFGLSAFIVHKISSGYAMIYFYVIDIMMRKSISSFTIYADNISEYQYGV